MSDGERKLWGKNRQLGVGYLAHFILIMDNILDKANPKQGKAVINHSAGYYTDLTTLPHSFLRMLCKLQLTNQAFAGIAALKSRQS